MLDQTVHWMQIAGTAVEALLLIRMLTLRLQRVYLFVTLFAALNLLLDVSTILVGVESDPGTRIFFYSRFLMAMVYPMAAWDIFEEAKTSLAKVRRQHAPRLISGLFITLLLGVVCSIGIEDKDVNGTSTSMDFVGLFLWLGAASTSLLFTWNVFRTARKAEVPLPNNTFVWSIFFLITFGRAIIDCGFDVGAVGLPRTAFQIVNVVFTLFDSCLISWCLYRLKPLPPDVTPAPQNATS